MATDVTIQQQVNLNTFALELGMFGVQRFLRKSGSKTPALNLMTALPARTICFHWSGGYNNANPGFQSWSTRDFAPGPDENDPQFTYTTSGSRKGLDPLVQDFTDYKALYPSAKLVLVLHDFPNAMLEGDTRTSQTNITPWPASTAWDRCMVLLNTIIPRIGASNVLAISYGQEFKGLANRTSTTELNAFTDGLIAFAAEFKATYPTVEIWFPHFNILATESSITARRNALASMLAGGSMSTNDNLILNTVLARANSIKTSIDRVTMDYSLLNYGTNEDWRGNWNQFFDKFLLGYHTARCFAERMQANWSTVKPIVSIENYFDVRLADNELYSDKKQAAGLLLNLMAEANAGVTHTMRWEPHGGTPGSETPNGNMQCLWDENGVKFQAYDYIKDFLSNFNLGDTLRPVTSSKSTIYGIATATKAFIVNAHDTVAESVTCIGDTASATPVSINPLEYAVITLPAVGGGGGSTDDAITIVQDKAFFKNGSAGDLTGTLDTAATNGNLCILVCFIQENPGNGTFATPSGWTLHSSFPVDNPSDSKVYVFYRTDFTGSSVAITGTPNTSRANGFFIELDNGASIESVNTNQANTGTAATGGSITITSGKTNRFEILCVIGKNVVTMTQSDSNYALAELVNENGAASGQKQTLYTWTRNTLSAGNYNPGATLSASQPWMGVNLIIAPTTTPVVLPPVNSVLPALTETKKTPTLADEDGAFNTGTGTPPTVTPTVAAASATDALILTGAVNQNAGANRDFVDPSQYDQLTEYAGASGFPPRVGIWATVAGGGETSAALAIDTNAVRVSAYLAKWTNLRVPLVLDGTPGSASGNASTATALDSGSVVTTKANSLIVACITTERGDITQATPGNGFTTAEVDNEVSTSNNSLSLYTYYKVANAGTHRAQPTGSLAAQYTGVILAFEAKTDTLSVSNGTWSNSPTSYTYQWLRDGVAINGQTTNSYTIDYVNDIGKVISCRVTAINSGGQASATSLGFAIPAPDPVPDPPSIDPNNGVPPSISGTATVGSTLTADHGVWLGSPTNYTYAWKKEGFNIPNATGTTYVVQSTDLNSVITVEVTATNGGGSNTAVSAGVTISGGSATSAVVSPYGQIALQQAGVAGSIAGANYLLDNGYVYRDGNDQIRCVGYAGIINLPGTGIDALKLNIPRASVRPNRPGY